MLWSGHVLIGVTACLLFLTGYFLWEAARGETAGTMLVKFSLAVLAFVITLLVGIIAAWRYKSRGERRYVRRENDLITNALEPAGRVDLGETPRSAGVPFQGVSAAQVAEERVTGDDR